jgi:hypothetical protein
MAERDTPDPTDALAGAEVDAAREAAAEAARKVITPKSRTSSKAPAQAGSAKAATPPRTAAMKAATDPDMARATKLPPRQKTDVPSALPAEPPRNVSGDTITVRQGGIDVVNATNVDLRQGGIGRARATDIAVTQGGVGAARADRVSVELGGIGAALAGELTVTQGAAGSIVAREARVQQSFVRLLIANVVHVERPSGVLFLVARKVDGNVKAILDWRGALAFGAAFGVVTSIFRRRRR